MYTVRGQVVLSRTPCGTPFVIVVENLSRAGSNTGPVLFCLTSRLVIDMGYV